MNWALWVVAKILEILVPRIWAHMSSTLPQDLMSCSIMCVAVDDPVVIADKSELRPSWEPNPRGSKALNIEYLAQTIIMGPCIES